jgi:hypothetical protein
MDVKLKHLHEEGGDDYIIRVCMSVADALADTVVDDSIIRQCDECGVDVWFHTKQQVPVVLGKVFAGEVLLCMSCTVMHAALDNEPMKWA